MHTFISYSSKDHEIARRICEQLEARGVRCWIAPRDIPPGATYARAIIDGISGAVSIVLILSDNSNLSHHVQAEVERAFSLAKPVFPVRIRDVRPSKDLELFISGRQWIDALSPPLDSKMDELASAIRGLHPPSEPRHQLQNRRRHHFSSNLAWWAAIAAMALSLAIGVIFRPSHVTLRVTKTGVGNFHLSPEPRPDGKYSIGTRVTVVCDRKPKNWSSPDNSVSDDDGDRTLFNINEGYGSFSVLMSSDKQLHVDF